LLIDYIDISKLPWVVVWLDWCFYAYRKELVVCLFMSYFHGYLFHGIDSLYGLSLAMLVGICLWVVYCVVRYGYGIG